MPQFRPLPSFHDDAVPEMTGELSNNALSAPAQATISSTRTITTTTTTASPEQFSFLQHQPRITGQFTHISYQLPQLPDLGEPLVPTGPTTDQLPSSNQLAETEDTGDTGDTGKLPALTTRQLTALTGISLVTSTTGRFLRIPAPYKREQVTEELPKPPKRMSPRLRHGLTLFAVLLVALTTMLSLSPLDNGQSNVPLIGGISEWVHAQQLNWQLTAQQMQQVAQVKPAQSNSTTQQNSAPPAMNLPKSQYIAIAQQDATNAGISPVYFVRQINQESGFNPNAYSPAGAEGIAQFEPGTAAGLGINPWDPIQALNGAAHLMASYNNKYGGNYAMALAAYNGGSGTVQYAVNACGSSWMNCLPPETRNYIYVIMGI